MNLITTGWLCDTAAARLSEQGLAPYAEAVATTRSVLPRQEPMSQGAQVVRTFAEWRQGGDGLIVQEAHALLRGGNADDRRMRGFCAFAVGARGLAQHRCIARDVEQIILDLERQAHRVRKPR